MTPSRLRYRCHIFLSSILRLGISLTALNRLPFDLTNAGRIHEPLPRYFAKKPRMILTWSAAPPHLVARQIRMRIQNTQAVPAPRTAEQERDSIPLRDTMEGANGMDRKSLCPCRPPRAATEPYSVARGRARKWLHIASRYKGLHARSHSAECRRNGLRTVIPV